MENNCTMVRNTGVGEDEVELELGLSIGGKTIKKAEKLKPRKKESCFDDHEKSYVFMDPLMKREIQALRRQEAKKKREEKQQKKRIICRGNKKNGEFTNAGFSVDDSEKRECKRNRRDDHDIKNVNLNLSIEENMNQNVGTVQYPYPYPNPNPMVQYYQYVNDGFAYPVAGRSRKTTSNGSPSSTVSDNKSSSHEGGGNSDTKSHSSHSLPQQHQLNGSYEHSSSSQLMEISQVIDKTLNCVEKMVPSDGTQSSPTRPKEEAVSDTQPVSTEKSVSNRSPSPLEETKVDMSEPPKSQTQNHNTPSLPHMPSVSTTGNGPNGKTINGFLYRYTKTEVNIICVCHGTSFSPAEFVQHAGGTAVTNPLRHITVIPSAF